MLLLWNGIIGTTGGFHSAGPSEIINSFLVPGNSPIGLRFPLKSLTYISEAKGQRKVERSSFEPLPALENFQTKVGFAIRYPLPMRICQKNFIPKLSLESKS